jgi:hypothetical protein
MSVATQSLAGYNREVDRLMPGGIKRWKILKTVLLSGMVLAFGIYTIDEGADPTTVGLFALTVVGAIAGVEWSELEAVKFVTVSDDGGDDE